MKKKESNQTQDNDKETFLEAMKTVKPLHPKKNRTQLKSTVKKASPSKQNNLIHSIEPIAFSDYIKLPLLSSEDLVNFARNGIQIKILQKLCKNKYNAQATLDLHGNTTDQARMKVGEFLIYCQENNINYIQIIHGRGNEKPIIKNLLNHWLRQTNIVLAFKSINCGALHVLLRRKKF